MAGIYNASAACDPRYAVFRADRPPEVFVKRLNSAFVLLLVGALLGCKREDSSRRHALSVFAASSLREVFQQLESEFEQRNPQVDVRVSFAGSQVLRLQIEQGAPADVFVSANHSHLQALVEKELITRAERLTGNELAVIVPLSNPAGLASFKGLSSAGKIIVAERTVPMGLYTQQFLKQAGALFGDEWVAGVRAHVVSRENNARLVRAKVELGEADAAIVYRTDALASKLVSLVPLPAALKIRSQYWVGVIRSPRVSSSAGPFVEFLHSDIARAAFLKHGYVIEAL